MSFPSNVGMCEMKSLPKAMTNLHNQEDFNQPMQ